MAKSSTRASKRPAAKKSVPAEPPADLLTMDDAIALLKTTRPTFYRWLRGGKLKGMKIGRQWRFKRAEIDRFLTGEQPHIDLPADIGPLIAALKSRLESLGGDIPEPDDRDQVRLAVDLMICLAIAMNTSDIHIDPRKDATQLRLRVDGALQLITQFDTRLLPAIARRWKLMAGMDVLQEKLPQDGRAVAIVHGKSIDLRVCCVPAYVGEAIAARILRADTVCLDLDRLPYAPADRKRLLRWLDAPWGLILFTGPTGCGKTTSLYGCLGHVANENTKVVTIEDPVEYLLPGMTQIQINPKEGLTFERATRSVLRLDPDVIMIGEIRNAEMLQLAFQAGLTGHLVLTTLHTNEAAAGLRRMIDIGCEPFVVADATKLAVAQRLVRKLCPECSQPFTPTAEMLAIAEQRANAGGIPFGTLSLKYRRPVGCAKCGQLGFRGRTLIAEALEMSPEIAAALRRGATVDEIRALAVQQGMTTMAADGIQRASEGLVSLPEVLGAVGGIGV